MRLNAVKEMLETEEYTCVLTDGVQLFSSRCRGVKPLVQFFASATLPPDLYAADKVVGKATAYLYVLLRIKALYAKVISESALEVLRSFDIDVQYDHLVPYIINRDRSGMCPFEKAVLEIDEPKAAYIAICRKMEELHISLV